MTDDEKKNHAQDALRQMMQAQKALKAAHRLYKMAGLSLSAEQVNGLVGRLNDEIKWIRELSL